MPDQCRRTFDEAMLSGYVDRMLTQADEQRVRVHLEDCAVCRAQVEDISRLKEVTMSSEFREPADEQWSEVPRGRASQFTFGVGWSFLIVWALVTTGYGLWQFWTSEGALFGKLIVFVPLSALVLLFVSVLIDRVKAMRTDRYREVQK
jgi:anti-sigma factor RsiW